MPELHIVHAGDVVDTAAEQDAVFGAVQITEPLTPAHLEHQGVAAQRLPSGPVLFPGGEVGVGGAGPVFWALSYYHLN